MKFGIVKKDNGFENSHQGRLAVLFWDHILVHRGNEVHCSVLVDQIVDEVSASSSGDDIGIVDTGFLFTYRLLKRLD